jgi:hypothetical protein
MYTKCQDPSSVPPWSLGLPFLGVQEWPTWPILRGDVPDLGLNYFVHAHILREELNHSLSMLYGHKAIRLPNPGHRLYSCKSLTLQFDQMGEARHSFVGPPCTHGRARMEAT